MLIFSDHNSWTAFWGVLSSLCRHLIYECHYHSDAKCLIALLSFKYSVNIDFESILIISMQWVILRQDSFIEQCNPLEGSLGILSAGSDRMLHVGIKP